MGICNRTLYAAIIFMPFVTLVHSTLANNPLDIGSVSSCVYINSTICPTIDYMVPESIANLTNVIDEVIASTYARISPDDQSAECSSGILESLCNQQYPRCNLEEKLVNAQIALNCTQRLSTCTSAGFADGYCSFEIVNASLDQCKTIAELTNETGYVFKRCNHISAFYEDYVTKWMFKYLISIDNDVDQFLNLYPATEQCTLDYIDFRCRSVGRCWDNGNRVELTRNQTDCMAVRSINCFSSKALQILQPKGTVCEQWPVESQLPTITTPITPDPPIQPVNSSTTTPSPSSPSSSLSSTVVQATSSNVLPINTSVSTIFPNSAKSINHPLGSFTLVACTILIVFLKLLL